MRGILWFGGYAWLVRTAEEAREALDAQPKLMPLEYYPDGLNARGLHSAMGNTYLLAGGNEEAIPHLKHAAADCNVFFRPIGNTLDHYRLGMARQALGDTNGACEAYAVVLDRWGDAKPRLPITDDTRARVKALHCPRR